ncbi:universal stress protein [Parasulfitobacter algicola]|uniref:Universal stress protein n=1 Tax=Parasulfitobacter algicola TaxID=2614809 RepID=A0ABX2IN55_9RHOB|nr:universal stress protein [Sulfitobacter algicola]NSX54317.1 universal stress protein [Sulfitobacter algicola]
MYKNVLVPIVFDDDHDASDAIEIAKAISADGASITLLHVMDEIPSYALSYLSDEYLTNARLAIVTEMEKMVSDVENGHADVVNGHSGRTILEYADEKKNDCIVITSHTPGMQDYLLGSTASKVVRHAKCSVHVVR